MAAVTIAAGLGYTGYSEWLNVYERQSWAYDPAMPTIDVAGYAIGLSPLGQWIVVPAVALAVTRMFDLARPVEIGIVLMAISTGVNCTWSRAIWLRNGDVIS